MYWKFDEEDLRATTGMQSSSIAPSVSTSGDDCHSDIIGSTDKGQRNFVLNYCKPPNLFFENSDNDDVPISQEIYKSLSSIFP